ncbi:hypothetical protein DFJ63DRAFT_314413 [Scheffersomyces coipomensis]|uniref:uncharacterized protein n=1 Tax=Scheffersomyces coipomensis TaxID=1788519 RepID=UPI00315CF62C
MIKYSTKLLSIHHPRHILSSKYLSSRVIRPIPYNYRSFSITNIRYNTSKTIDNNNNNDDNNNSNEDSGITTSNSESKDDDSVKYINNPLLGMSNESTTNTKDDNEVTNIVYTDPIDSTTKTIPLTEATDAPPSTIISTPTNVQIDDGFGTSDFLTTIFDDMEPYMDTYEVYQELISAGFTSNQADEIINLIIVQLNSKLSKLSSKYSQVYELENERYLFESAQQELRVDVTRSREQHINELISLTNVLERDFNIISDDLNNEFLQLKNDNAVTINDQRSENTLQSKKIILKIQETNHKITTELNSAMRSEIESLRWNLSRWGLIAILITVFSGCAAFYAEKAKHTRIEKSRSDFIPLVIYEPSEIDEDDYHTDLDKNALE